MSFRSPFTIETGCVKKSLGDGKLHKALRLPIRSIQGRSNDDRGWRENCVAKPCDQGKRPNSSLPVEIHRLVRPVFFAGVFAAFLGAIFLFGDFLGAVFFAAFLEGPFWGMRSRKRDLSIGSAMPNIDLPTRVLIVDDEKGVRESLAAVFTNHGYETRTANSAESAVEIVAQWLPNLAILDVDLPKMNGIDLAVALKSGHPDCRVLLFSGHPRTLDLLAQAEAEGHIFEILAKPAHPPVMLDKASVLLSGDLHEIAKPPGELETDRSTPPSRPRLSPTVVNPNRRPPGEGCRHA